MSLYLIVEDALTDPKHIEQGFSMTDGFTIGGHSHGDMNNLSDSKGIMQSKTLPSPYDPKRKLGNDTQLSSKNKKKSSVDPQSFIFNEDMKRIRKAEGVILHAEAKFGVLSRDPEGRLVPILQVLCI